MLVVMIDSSSDNLSSTHTSTHGRSQTSAYFVVLNGSFVLEVVPKCMRRAGLELRWGWNLFHLDPRFIVWLYCTCTGHTCLAKSGRSSHQTLLHMATQLSTLDPGIPHIFIEPTKRINEGQDVSRFLVSSAYGDITLFLVQLNRAMFPRKGALEAIAHMPESSTVSRLKGLLKAIDEAVDGVPLDPGTHRFGNTAFRKWYQVLEERSLQLLKDHLPVSVIDFPHENGVASIQELKAYLLGSFGSAQRLDYGTGHELSFLAFVASIWKLGGFDQSNAGSEERSIVLNVIEP